LEEIHAHLEGPVAAVFVWVEALTAGDWRALMALSADTFRLVRAQAWLWNNRNHPGIAGEDLDPLASGLVVDDPRGELWTDSPAWSWPSSERPGPTGI
jgi:hypothetical protein